MCVYVCMYVYVYVRMYVYVYVCMYVCMYVCVFVCVCTYVRVFVCVCVYVACGTQTLSLSTFLVRISIAMRSSFGQPTRIHDGDISPRGRDLVRKHRAALLSLAFVHVCR